MARTYSYGDLANIIAPFIPRNVEERSLATIMNVATNEIWNRYDWRETLKYLPPFWLYPLRQDYGVPAYAVPTDFLALRTAYLSNLGSEPPTRWDLFCTKDLKLTQIRALPDSIAYEPTTSSFRVFPRPPDNCGSPQWLVDGTYKIRPTKITPATLDSTLLPFDDLYIQTWIDVAKWAAWAQAGDSRAGQQYLVQREMVDQMAISEGCYLGDPAVAPSESLADSVWVPAVGPWMGW